MEQLELLREDLAQCDEILLNTLLMRNRIVEQIMANKEANNIAKLHYMQKIPYQSQKANNRIIFLAKFYRSLVGLNHHYSYPIYNKHQILSTLSSI